MEKKCTKCGVFRSYDDFGNHKKGKNGKRHECKICSKKMTKIYRENNREKVNQATKKCKENYKKEKRNNLNTLDFIKLFNQNNGLRKCNKCKVVKSLKEFANSKIIKSGKVATCKDCIKEYTKIYLQENKEKYKEYKKEYYSKNKDRLIKETSLYSKKKRETDSLYKLRSVISHRIRQSIKTKGYTKKTKTYNILKCEYDFFMQFINGVASNGYTYGIGDLHLDHVIPISLAQTEDEALLLSHYSNYQLLSAEENITKSNRYVNPLNLARVLEHHPDPDKIREIYTRLKN
jgi:hypothetical protein